MLNIDGASDDIFGNLVATAVTHSPLNANNNNNNNNTSQTLILVTGNVDGGKDANNNSGGVLIATVDPQAVTSVNQATQRNSIESWPGRTPTNGNGNASGNGNTVPNGTAQQK